MKVFDAYEGKNELVYVCPKGTTASSVAERFGIPVEKLLKDNGVEDISAGDQLVVLRGGGRSYRVKAGDTAESIADAFGVSEEEILALGGGYIYPAQTLYIPEKTGK